MLAVLRLIGPGNVEGVTAEIEARIGKKPSNIRNASGIAVTLSESPEWSDVVANIAESLSLLRLTLGGWAHTKEVEVLLDQDDVTSLYVNAVFGRELIGLMAKCGADLIVTFSPT
jgi:hypothetical protein